MDKRRNMKTKMHNLIQLVKFTFFTTPRSAAMWAQQNEQRIGFITVMIMILIVFLTLFGQLPTWTFIK